MRAMNPAFFGSLQNPLAVSLSDTVAYGFILIEHPPAPSTAFTNNIVVSVYGGYPPYTLNWTRVSGSNEPVISLITGYDVVWSLAKGTNTIINSVWHCTVTDSVANMVASDNVSVELEFEA